MAWYAYTPITFPGNICDSNNYTLIGIFPPVCPSPKIFLCAIQAYDNMGHPILTPVLIGEIATALQNRMESVNVLLKP